MISVGFMLYTHKTLFKHYFVYVYMFRPLLGHRQVKITSTYQEEVY